MPASINIVFVCGQNNRRSLTAEKLYKNDRRFDVRQAGLSDKSKQRLSDEDMKWADLVVTMERKHAKRIRSAYSHMDQRPEIESLDIQDKFNYMQPELMEEIAERLEYILEDLFPELCQKAK